MVSDALCGVGGSSSVESIGSPVLNDANDDTSLLELLDSVNETPKTSTPRYTLPQFGGKAKVDSRNTSNEESGQLQSGKKGSVDDMSESSGNVRSSKGGKKRNMYSTVSSMVLHRGERWSKEDLRKWMKARKKRKLAESYEKAKKKGEASSSQVRKKVIPLAIMIISLN